MLCPLLMAAQGLTLMVLLWSNINGIQLMSAISASSISGTVSPALLPLYSYICLFPFIDKNKQQTAVCTRPSGDTSPADSWSKHFLLWNKIFPKHKQQQSLLIKKNLNIQQWGTSACGGSGFFTANTTISYTLDGVYGPCKWEGMQ